MRKIFAVLVRCDLLSVQCGATVPAAQAFTLDKEDGEYSIQVELEGGSGKGQCHFTDFDHSQRRRSNCRYPVEQF